MGNKKKAKVADSEKEREWALKGLLPQTELKFDDFGEMFQFSSPPSPLLQVTVTALKIQSYRAAFSSMAKTRDTLT